MGPRARPGHPNGLDGADRPTGCPNPTTYYNPLPKDPTMTTQIVKETRVISGPDGDETKTTYKVYVDPGRTGIDGGILCELDQADMEELAAVIGRLFPPGPKAQPVTVTVTGAAGFHSGGFVLSGGGGGGGACQFDADGRSRFRQSDGSWGPWGNATR
jgi:hypothetical protein